MSSGLPDSQGSRFDFNDSPATHRFSTDDADALSTTIKRTQRYLIERQHGEGYWVGELEGDTILESEYMLLLVWLEKENEPVFQQCANYILDQQNDDGGWSLYPGGPLEISSSVKAYFVLKIAGHDPHSEYMIRAKEAILAAGGAETVNSFTRYYLAVGSHRLSPSPCGATRTDVVTQLDAVQYLRNVVLVANDYCSFIIVMALQASSRIAGKVAYRRTVSQRC